MSQAGLFTVGSGGGATTYTENLGVASPLAGNLNILGGTGITTTGAGNTVTISATAATPLTFTEDSGVATPAANNLNILGTSVQGIVTSGATDTVTITADDASAVQKGVSSFDATNFTATAGNITSNAIAVTSGTNITATASWNLGGVASISASSDQYLTAYRVANSTPFVVNSTDFYITVDTSTIAITIQLPDAPTIYRRFIIKDSAGNAVVRNVTVTTVSGIKLIDGATTFVMNTNYQAIQLVYDGFGYQVF